MIEKQPEKQQLKSKCRSCEVKKKASSIVCTWINWVIFQKKEKTKKRKDAIDSMKQNIDKEKWYNTTSSHEEDQAIWQVHGKIQEFKWWTTKSHTSQVKLYQKNSGENKTKNTQKKSQWSLSIFVSSLKTRIKVNLVKYELT